jgi:hypothetical protein
MTASIAALVSANLSATSRAAATEYETSRASAFLDHVALWPTEDLDRHLGEREQGKWRLQVMRPGQAIYRVAILDSTGQRVLLATMLYRPNAERGANEH